MEKNRQNSCKEAEVGHLHMYVTKDMELHYSCNVEIEVPVDTSDRATFLFAILQVFERESRRLNKKGELMLRQLVNSAVIDEEEEEKHE